MEEKIARYIRQHTMSVTSAVLIAFLLLAAGEYYLFRKIMYVSRMVSEGLMQIKEAKSVKGTVLMKGGKTMFIRDSITKALDMNIMMSDGTKIMMNGTVVSPNGTQMMMREGQTFDIK